MRLVNLMFASLLGLLMTGCASTPLAQQQREEPGLYNLVGWNDYLSDINGEVGHPLSVSAPTARCAPSGNWTTSGGYVASGTLPPGLTMATSPPYISGIPRERGHWIVRMKVDTVMCNGLSYKGIDQELRFHITGSGKVVN